MTGDYNYMLTYNVRSCKILANHGAEEEGERRAHWGKGTTQDGNSRPREKWGEKETQNEKQSSLILCLAFSIINI